MKKRKKRSKTKSGEPDEAKQRGLKCRRKGDRERGGKREAPLRGNPGSVLGPSVKEERSQCRDEGMMKRAMRDCRREAAGWLADWLTGLVGVGGGGGGSDTGGSSSEGKRRGKEVEVVEARAVVKEEGGGGDCAKKSRHTGWLGAVQINASQPAR